MFRGLQHSRQGRSAYHFVPCNWVSALTKSILLCIAILLAIYSPPSHAKHETMGELYTTPKGVMGDHLHKQGGMMLSYSYMQMNMSGNRDGQKRTDVDDVLQHFPVAPTSMTTRMHLMGVSWAPANWLTMMGMIPYVSRSMDHTTGVLGDFKTSSGGIGDVSLMAMMRVFSTATHHVHVNMGLVFPTGPINERDDTPTMRGAALPYPMQIGSGTFDLRPGMTYTGRAGKFRWGGQIGAVLRLGSNTNDYSQGDRYWVTPWVAMLLGRATSVSARLNYQSWGDVKGANPELNALMVQTSDPAIQAGDRLDLLFGLNFRPWMNGTSGHLFSVEAGFPIHQNLNGPQLETDLSIFAGWQFMF